MATPRGVLAVLLALVALLFLELPGSWLVDADETRYAEISREMSASGDWVTPRLNGAAWTMKPPLLYWLEAGSFEAFGKSDFVARLPARLAAVGSAAILLLEAPRGAGPWAALVLLSAPFAFVLGRFNITDGLLSFFLVAASLLLRRSLAALVEGRRPRLLLAAFGAAVAGAMMTKGIVGVAIPGLALLAWAAVLGRWRPFRDVILSPAPPVFLLLVAPWFLLMERANPGFLHYFVFEEHLSRYASTGARHHAPVYYLAGIFLAGLLPWSAFLIGAVRPLLTRSREALRGRSDDLFLALWVAVVVLFFSASKSRLATYVYPALPAAAILVGRFLHGGGTASPIPFRVIAIVWTVLGPIAAIGVARREAAEGLHLSTHVAWGMAAVVAGSWAAVAVRRRSPAAAPLLLASGMAGLFLAVALALPEVSRRRSLHDLAVAAGREKDAEVVTYDCFSYSLPWVLERPVPAAAYGGEMATDGVYPPEIFWSEEEFWVRWGSGRRIAAVVRSQDLAKFRKPGRPAPRFLVEPPEGRRGFALVANYLADPR